MSDWMELFRGWATKNRGAHLGQIVLHERALGGIALTRILGTLPEGALLVAVKDAQELENLSNALGGFMDILQDKRPIIPIPDVSLGRRQWLPENEASRSAALQEILAGTPAIYIASAQTLLSQTLSPKSFAKKSFSIKVKDKTSPEELAKKLVELDYDNEFEVGSPGEFARRGGIMDIFSPLYADPVRLEFWGDEIDSMRFFSASTQRSTEEISEFKVTPRGAALLASAPEETTLVHDYFSTEIPMALMFPDAIEDHIEQFAEEADSTLDSWQRYISTVKHLIRVEEPPVLEDGRVAQLGHPELDVAVLGEELFADITEDEDKGVALWHWQQLKSSLLRWHDSGYQLVACCGAEGEIDRLKELLAQDTATASLPIDILHRSLAQGLLFPTQKLALLSDQELFGGRMSSACAVMWNTTMNTPGHRNSWNWKKAPWQYI